MLVLALGPDWQERWRLTDLRGPVEAQMLFNGHLLVVENHGERVTERARNGKTVWEKGFCGRIPCSCQRLTNGNTFIATDLELMEVTRAGKILWSATPGFGRINWATRLDDERYLMTTAKENRQDRVGVWYFHRKQNRFRCLATFHTSTDFRPLLCTAVSAKRFLVYRNLDTSEEEPGPALLEIDEQGDVYKRPQLLPFSDLQGQAPQFTCLHLHPYGNMLFCQSEPNRIVEVDPTGKILRHKSITGRPWFVQFVR